MKASRVNFEAFMAYGFVMSAFIFSNLPPAHSAGDEEVGEEILQQKMEQHGMDPHTSQVFKPPKMTDEEIGSRHMPKHLRCGSCVAVAHQFENEYKSALKSVKSKGKLSLADQIEVAETVCDKRLHEYGLKEHEGKKVLSGPGLAATDIQGMMEGGGKWEARLKTLCFEIIEEFEEEGIYDIYKEAGSRQFALGLCGSYCKNKDEITSLKTADPASAKTEL